MARGGTKSPQAAENEQEEMTVVIFKLKGGPGTLQKGFDAITTAFNSFGAPTTLPASNTRRVSSNSSKQLPESAPEIDDQDNNNNLDEDEGQIVEAQSSSNPNKTRQPRRYKFMDNLDLTKGEKAWKDFAREKAPKTDSDKYLVAAQWLTEYANIPEFGITHVFTCFRAVGWPEVRDFSQPMRQMKSKKSYFTNPSKKLWKLTGPGLDAAQKVKGTVPE